MQPQIQPILHRCQNQPTTKQRKNSHVKQLYNRHNYQHHTKRPTPQQTRPHSTRQTTNTMPMVHHLFGNSNHPPQARQMPITLQRPLLIKLSNRRLIRLSTIRLRIRLTHNRVRTMRLHPLMTSLLSNINPINLRVNIPVVRHRHMVLPRILLISSLRTNIIRHQLSRPKQNRITIKRSMSIRRLIHSKPIIQLILKSHSLIIRRTTNQLRRLRRLVRMITMILHTRVFRRTRQNSTIRISFQRFTMIRRTRLNRVLRPFTPSPLLAMLSLLIQRQCSRYLSTTLNYNSSRDTPTTSSIGRTITKLRIRLIRRRISFITLHIVRTRIKHIRRHTHMHRQQSSRINMRLIQRIVVRTSNLKINLFNIQRRAKLSTFRFQKTFKLQRLRLIMTITRGNHPRTHRFRQE